MGQRGRTGRRIGCCSGGRAGGSTGASRAHIGIHARCAGNRRSVLPARRQRRLRRPPLRLEGGLRPGDGHPHRQGDDPARATQNLSRFNLDFVGLTSARVTVNGRPAEWSRDGEELDVTPRRRHPRSNAGSPRSSRYDGVRRDHLRVRHPSGFLHTDDGALVIGQPHVADTWFPVNDHPIDKASYTFEITVPRAWRPSPTASAVGAHPAWARPPGPGAPRNRWRLTWP